MRKRTVVGLEGWTLNLTALDFDGNLNLILGALERYAKDFSPREADLFFAVFPELALTGPGCQDAFLRPGVLKKAAESLLEVERKTPKNVVAAVGLPIAFGGALYKGTALVVSGKIRGFVCSTFLPNVGRDEFRQFSAWPKGKTATISLFGREFPIGDLTFEERGVRFVVRSIPELAQNVGEDANPFFQPAIFDEKSLYAARDARRENVASTTESSENSEKTENSENSEAPNGERIDADVVLVPGATPFSFGSQAKIRRLLATISRRDGSASAYANPIGVESGSTIYDGGSAFAFDGTVCQRSRFLYAQRSAWTRRIEKFDANLRNVVGARNLIAVDGRSFSFELDAWETDENVRFEEFARATAFGILDYMRKSRSKGLALSLSGGADSATIAVLVRLGVRFGCEQFGVADFLRWLVQYDSKNGTLRAFPALAKFAVDRFGTDDLKKIAERFEDGESSPGKEEENELERGIVAALLTTVYQATRNSGDATRRAAREVANFCGATFYEFEIDELVEGYKKLVADATGVPFSWKTDDLALQNVQARTRAPSVWLLANRSGRLLLSTGNRSEVACGYATMDGDSCGGLSPIAGVDKDFIRSWLKWEEKTGVETFYVDPDADGYENDVEFSRFPAPALRFINEQQPTAELRPAEAKQTDEADLMPYSILNRFERALIRDRLELDAAIRRVKAESGFDVDDETLAGWGVRFCRLWARSQWKRQRYAPGFALDDYDLAPTSWTKYPILSGGFEAEIAAFEMNKAKNRKE